jgi:2-deoxy-D-gluconate 3-dehydrogenase
MSANNGTRSLDGQAAIVTGASRGIGRATAIRLAADGASVVLAGRAEADLAKVGDEIAAEGGTAVVCPGDLRSSEDRHRLVDSAMSRFGEIAILVNNAAVNRVEPSVEVALETWTEIIDTNVTAVFFLTQLVGLQMLEQGHGRIISVGSDAGSRGFAGHAAYGASKAALAQLTRVLANEWGPKGVRVNLVAPGATWTEMTAPAMEIPEIRDDILRRGVVGKICTPEEVAGSIAYLASSEADMITGHVLAIDGGSSAR